MQDTCLQCGQWRADKEIDPAGPFAICPECGHRQPFRQLPLLVVTGASGTGKSTVCTQLVGTIDEVVLLDGDLLWQPEYAQPEGDQRRFYETWLRVVKSISQAGRPVVLFGAGLGVPENLERCVQRRFLGPIYRLALTCDPGELEARLRARPQWRNCDDPAYVQAHVDFNRWFLEHADRFDPPIQLLDTTAVPVAETVARVAAWVRKMVR
jgi:hypothetical protein